MHVVNLTRAMNRGRWRTRLVAGSVPETEGDMEYYARERGVELHRLEEMSRRIDVRDDARTLWALYRLFRRERPDVVHTHTAKAGTLGRIAAILAGVPVRVHTFHGHVLGGGYFSALRTRVFLEVERQLARGTQRLVVLTHRQAREMSEELGVAAPARFAVVPLGLELGRFTDVDRGRERAAVREELGVGPEDLAVGIVGRLVPIKNHELFVDALAALRARSSRPVRGLVVGSGEREGELRARACEAGLDDALVWLGWRRDLPRLYAAMDVLALTSHDEGTPVAVIEALAAGVRVVARDVGGVAEMLAGAELGTVVPRDADGEGWAEALARACALPEPGPEVRARVAASYSVERLAGDLEALYLSLGAGT